MESGHKSGGGSAPGGGAGGDGVLCHACGYQYPNGHPSAKQRRAHRKHCGKPTSAAAAGAAEEGAGEHEGSEPLPGDGRGEGIGAGAAECGGSLPGSAPEAASAVDGGDNHSSGNGTGHQVIGSEDHLISSSNIPSEIISEASKTNDDTLATVVTQYSDKGSPIEDGDSSDPAVGSGGLEGVPVSVLSPELEDGAKSTSGISEHEIKNSTVVPLESNATGSGTSEQTDVVSQADGTAVAEEDDMTNTIDKNEFSENKSVEGDEVDISCKDNIQTENGEGHSRTAVERDPSDKNPNAIQNEEILSDKTESNQQSKHVLTDSSEKIPNIEVPVEASAENSVGSDDASPQLGTGGSHSETCNDVKPQQQRDSTSETACHLAVSKQSDNVHEQHYPIPEGSIPVISSASGPAVGAIANTTENVCSSGVTMDDSMQKNVTGGTVVASQVDQVELSASTMAHEINTVGSTNDVDEKSQNEKGDSDFTSYGGNEMHVVENFEEKHQNKEVIVDSIPHETNTVSNADNDGENEQNKEIIADTSSCKINVVQSMTSAEENEQIEEFITSLASEETSVACSRDIVEEKQSEIDVKTIGEIDGACSIQTAAENNATTCESNAGTTTDDVEDIVQDEEITAGPISHGINTICSGTNEEKMHKEDVIEAIGCHENIVVHGTDNVEEKTVEEATADATSPKFSLVTSTESVEEKKGGQTAADPTLQERSAGVVHSTDNIDEKKNEQPVLDPTTASAAISSIGHIEEKKQSEETIAGPSSGESNMLPGTDDAENKEQNGDVATTGPASDKTEVAETTNADEEIGKTEEAASKEISTIESTDDLKGVDDQNEEIADKEMVIDSDKNHVSLKVLLADKNVETKEKEKKPSTKDRVLSFRRRASKDVVSPVKPGSPKAGSGQQDWNSPARLPVEKKPKGRKQQWVPFICCSSVQ
ncbi:hypothetical protein PVAP13_6NG318800 [Panicum virgatum]|uniref:Uncharacterized protein n=1 Tax=Panicum virgatum TaxID=38727 RepID=A0A8T0R4L6_PANVG|nr:hypothetical protein PVAP13_6NG318800 [Panicum virgatum]